MRSGTYMRTAAYKSHKTRGVTRNEVKVGEFKGDPPRRGLDLPPNEAH